MSLVKRLRQWAHGHTRQRRYSPVGQTFHWTMAALVVFQLWWGWRMGRLPVGGEKLEAYQLHSQVGAVLLVLILMRGAWRLMVPGPKNDADKPGWQRTAAHATHYAFYAILLILPLTGWAMWSAMAAEQPIELAGVVTWPLLPLHDLPSEIRWRIMDVGRTVHLGLAILLIFLILGHVGAALKHHFWNRDDATAGMVPFLDPPENPREPSYTPPDQPSPQGPVAG
ncbi:MAG TPA: cytochrome b [Phenylobacterium sp.]|nr:cytochrome b [Phenylobacterium sp.]